MEENQEYHTKRQMKLVDAKTYCDYLRIHRKTLQNWVKAGKVTQYFNSSDKKAYFELPELREEVMSNEISKK